MPLSEVKMFQYNSLNNFYVQVEMLQQAIIMYYELQRVECGDKFVFVLRLYES